MKKKTTQVKTLSFSKATHASEFEDKKQLPSMISQKVAKTRQVPENQCMGLKSSKQIVFLHNKTFFLEITIFYCSVRGFQ
jgi:hypothetical protein